MTRRTQLLFLMTINLPFFLLVYGFFNVYAGFLYPDRDYTVISLLLGIPFFVLLMLKENIDNKSINIIARLLFGSLCILAVLSLDEDPRLVYGAAAFIGIELMRSLFTKGFTDDMSVFAVALGINFILFTVFALLDIPHLRQLFLSNFFISAIMWQCGGFLRRMDNFLRSNFCRNGSSNTIQTLLKHDYRLFGVFIAAFCLIGIFVMTRSYPVFEAPLPNQTYPVQETPSIAEDIQSDLEKLMSELMAAPTFDPEDEPVFEELQPNYMARNLFIFLVAVGVIAAIILFYDKMPRKNWDFEDFDEEIEEDKAEPVSRSGRIKPSAPSPNQAVRRLFFRKVKEHQRGGLIVKKHSTAKMITEEINRSENISLLNTLYHKARYSGEIVERTEITELKKREREQKIK